ncbi:MAG: hypothetical protein Q7J77_09960, partial [Undibacterium sp.]|nr:hypothetical protein [Undibacterium sp.]
MGITVFGGFLILLRLVSAPLVPWCATTRNYLKQAGPPRNIHAPCRPGRLERRMGIAWWRCLLSAVDCQCPLSIKLGTDCFQALAVCA